MSLDNSIEKLSKTAGEMFEKEQINTAEYVEMQKFCVLSKIADNLKSINKTLKRIEDVYFY